MVLLLLLLSTEDLSLGLAVLSTTLKDPKDLAQEVKGITLRPWRVFHDHLHLTAALRPTLCIIRIPAEHITVTHSHKPYTPILAQTLILMLQIRFIRPLRLYQIPTCTSRTVIFLIVTLSHRCLRSAARIRLTTRLWPRLLLFRLPLNGAEGNVAVNFLLRSPFLSQGWPLPIRCLCFSTERGYEYEFRTRTSLQFTSVLSPPLNSYGQTF